MLYLDQNREVIERVGVDDIPGRNDPVVRNVGRAGYLHAIANICVAADLDIITNFGGRIDRCSFPDPYLASDIGSVANFSTGSDLGVVTYASSRADMGVIFDKDAGADSGVAPDDSGRANCGIRANLDAFVHFDSGTVGVGVNLGE